MNPVQLVDDIAQQIPAHHPVLDPAKHRPDHVPPVVPVAARQLAEIGKQPGPALPGWQNALILVDERNHLVPRDPIRCRRPIPPPIRPLDRRMKLLPRQLRLPLPLDLQIIQKLQEHDPRQHRQAIEVAVETLVLAHDVARRFQERAEGLRGGRWRHKDRLKTGLTGRTG